MELHIYLGTILQNYTELGGYRPLLAIACQPPRTAYAVPIRIASLARHGMIAELRLPAALNLVFD